MLLLGARTQFERQTGIHLLSLGSCMMENTQLNVVYLMVRIVFAITSNVRVPFNSWRFCDTWFWCFISSLFISFGGCTWHLHRKRRFRRVSRPAPLTWTKHCSLAPVAIFNNLFDLFEVGFWFWTSTLSHSRRASSSLSLFQVVCRTSLSVTSLLPLLLPMHHATSLCAREDLIWAFNECGWCVSL